MHFALEMQQQPILVKARPTEVPLPALSGNSLCIKTEEHVGGQDGEGWRGFVPGCHSLGVTTLLQSLEGSWTERMRNAPASLGEISLGMPGAVICPLHQLNLCYNVI